MSLAAMASMPYSTGTGLATCDQAEPFQCWISPVGHTWPSPHEEYCKPTAQTSFVLTVVTSTRLMPLCPSGAGAAGKRVHRVPFQWQVFVPPTAHTSFEASAATSLKPTPQEFRTERHAEPSQ